MVKTLFDMESEEYAVTGDEAKIMGTPSTQREAQPGDVEVLPPSGRGGITVIPLGTTLEQLGQIKGAAAMMLACNIANRLEAELHETKKEKAELQKKCDDLTQSYSDERRQRAVLEVSSRQTSSKKNMQRIVIAIGALIGEEAYRLLMRNEFSSGLAASIVSGILLSLGFWPSESHEKHNQ